jgi:hypothetical protein
MTSSSNRSAATCGSFKRYPSAITPAPGICNLTCPKYHLCALDDSADGGPGRVRPDRSRVAVTERDWLSVTTPRRSSEALMRRDCGRSGMTRSAVDEAAHDQDPAARCRSRIARDVTSGAV